MELSRRTSIAAALDPHERHRVELLVAIADPLRIRLLKHLDRPRSVTELCAHLEMAQPRVSHHLGILREAGVIQARRDGRRRLYAWCRSDDRDTAEVQTLIQRWFAADAAATLPEPASTPAAPAPRVAPAPTPVTQEIEDYLL